MASDAEEFIAVLRAGVWSKSAILRQGVWLTLIVLLCYRLGTYIPVPGVNAGFMHALLDEHRQDALGLQDAFTGGAVRRFSLFTLGITPYLTAVGLIRSATPVIPFLARIKDLGLLGQQQLDRYVMYLAAVLALVSSYSVAIGLEGASNEFGPAVAHPGGWFRVTCALTLVAGTLLLSWMARLIDQHGFGPGVVLVGTSGLFVTLPGAIASLSGFGRPVGWPLYAVWCLLPGMVLAVALIVFFEQARRRIPIDMAKRQVGRRLFDVPRPGLPLRANPAGMSPSLSATSILLTPATLTGLLTAFPAVRAFVTGPLARGQPLYLLLYAAAVIILSFTVAAKQIDGSEIADRLRKGGQFIPGVRPGLQTADYIGRVRTRLVLPGAGYILALCVPLELLIGRFGLPDAFTGAALVGMVTLILEIVAQLDSVALSVRYEGLIRRPEHS
ncbi:MAG TPA: preprotein translocase subunit SecY [Acetobacteraceae bacterium]|nr:preprotein translocase subunit SecY [Acetobacteraceae bacterium]